MDRKERGFTLDPQRLLCMLLVSSLVLGDGGFRFERMFAGVAAPPVQLAPLPIAKMPWNRLFPKKPLNFTMENTTGPMSTKPTSWSKEPLLLSFPSRRS